jgi:ribosome maturation factor RimP
MLKEAIIKVVEEWMEGSSFFLVDVKISPDNDIAVEFESESEDVTIDDCVDLSKFIESKFDRDVEDFSLEVGSAGLGQPFKVLKQYEINIGNEVEVLTRDGKKQKGILKTADKESFSVEIACKVKTELSKRPVNTLILKMFRYDEVKSVRYVLQFS